MRNIIYTLLIGIILLPACVEEDHLDSVSSGNGFGDFSFRLVPEEYEGSPPKVCKKAIALNRHLPPPSDKPCRTTIG